MDIREKLEREICRAETLKTQYDNMHGDTARSLIIGRAITVSRNAIKADNKLGIQSMIIVLQALE